MSDMKCYIVQNKNNVRYTGYVFAETRGKARAYALDALREVGFRNIQFTDVSVSRVPELDDCFIHGEEGKIFDYDQVVTGGR